MNAKVIYQVGDEVQAEDGRIGVVIDTDKNPISQEPAFAQTLVVKFPDQSTVEASVDKFKAVHRSSKSKH